MTKEESIKKYADQYLAGKSEEKRAEFFDKPIERQYSAVMAWKRRQELRKPLKGLAAQDVLKHAQALSELIEMTDDFTEREYARMHEALDAAKQTLNDYYRLRNGRILRALEREQQELQARIDALRAEGAM